MHRRVESDWVNARQLSHQAPGQNPPHLQSDVEEIIYGRDMDFDDEDTEFVDASGNVRAKRVESDATYARQHWAQENGGLPEPSVSPSKLSNTGHRRSDARRKSSQHRSIFWSNTLWLATERN